MRIVFAVCAVLLFAGCAPAKHEFSSVDITGIQGYGNDFRLIDHTGKPRTMADFRGKVVAMFFGFTSCPDVCPTTLSEMSQVMKRLGQQSEKLQVLFVTVDPKRDTGEVLSKYVPSFNPAFLGLYGDEATTKRVTRDFKIIARVVDGQTPDSYSVDHTAGMLIFDTRGRLRLMAPYQLGADKLTTDIKQLLD